MIDRLTLHYTLRDIADYFRECFKNASPGSSAQVRFDRYIVAAEEADRLLKEQESMVLDLFHAAIYMPIVWFEYREYPPIPAKIGIFSETGDIVEIQMFGCREGDMQPASDYGKQWRCWSSCPTDEQREGTAWEMPEAKTDEQN